MATGSGGLSVANQIHDRFKAAGKPLNEGDVAIVDGAEYHYYQVCSFLSVSYTLYLLHSTHSLDGSLFIKFHSTQRSGSTTGLSLGLGCGQRVTSVARLKRKSRSISPM